MIAARASSVRLLLLLRGQIDSPARLLSAAVRKPMSDGSKRESLTVMKDDLNYRHLVH
jgi:hypothetical protein